MGRSQMAATPPAATAVVLAGVVLLALLLPSATVTSPVKLGTTLPSASSADSCTAGAIWWPAVVVTGWTLNASCVAAAGAALKSLLVPTQSAAPATAARRKRPVLSALGVERLAAALTEATGSDNA